jgi:hypothetical protein
MTRESLHSMPLEELVALAREEGYDEDGSTDRAALTEFILENVEDRAREKEQENSPFMRVEESKYQLSDPLSHDGAGPDIYPIADRYNRTKIVFMVRDPHWAFAYWDLDDKTCEKLPDKNSSFQLILRVHETVGVDGSKPGTPSSFDIPIQRGDSRWYIYLPNQNRSYLLELGIIARGKYSCLARSNPIHTPRESVSESRGYASDWSSDSDLLYMSGSSGSIPQRILTVGRE